MPQDREFVSRIKADAAVMSVAVVATVYREYFGTLPRDLNDRVVALMCSAAADLKEPPDLQTVLARICELVADYKQSKVAV